MQQNLTAAVNNKTKARLVQFLATSLVTKGADRCVEALVTATTAKDIAETIQFIQKAKLTLNMRHGELYIATNWRVPWETLTRHEIMAVRMLFAQYGTCAKAHIRENALHSAFCAEEYVSILMSKLGPALRQAVQVLCQHYGRWTHHCA